MFKVIQNPKTGKMETVQDIPTVTKESLAELHKEVRDMIEGNTQFHTDPNSPPVVVPETPAEPDEYSWVVY